MWKIPQLHEQNRKIFLKRKNTKKSLKEADCNYPRIIIVIHRIILGENLRNDVPKSWTELYIILLMYRQASTNMIVVAREKSC